MIRDTKPKVAIVSYPWPSNVPYQFMSQLSAILDPIADRILIIDGNTDRITRFSDKTTLVDVGIRMHFFDEIKPAFYSAILWLIKTLAASLKASYALIRWRASVDVVLFYAAEPLHLLPLITAKVLMKRTVEVVNVGRAAGGIGKLTELLNPIVFRLLDGISPISRTLIQVHNLEKYGDKLLPEGSRYIDTSHYKVKTGLAERRNVVGYIARLRKEKGIIEFVRAIPLILQECEGVTVLIGGSGDLEGWVATECEKIKETLGADIVCTGWIGEDLPDYLNQLKLLVLPSHSEALPTTLLQAMACGTPVLAPAIGGIVDIVKDRETGFLLQEIEPQCIAKCVTQILAHPEAEIDNIVKNGTTLVLQQYSYAAAVERYRKIIGATF